MQWFAQGATGSGARVSPRELIVLLESPARLPAPGWEPGRALGHSVEGSQRALLKTYVHTKTPK